MSWEPAQYLKYSAERLRPALDLLARIPLGAPRTVIDLGCGAGNVTQVLAQRWPHARITGVDNSATMLERAQAAPMGTASVDWVEADLATWTPAAPVDVVYSNAALHWLDDHPKFFPRIFGAVAPGGALAVQMPDQSAAPSHVALGEVVTSARWRERLAHLRRAPILSAAAYFGLLEPEAQSVDAWTTEYLHVLPAARDGEHPVVAWTRGTALTPYLSVLDDEQKRAFVVDYTERIVSLYPTLSDGRVLFPFRRVFMVALRAVR